MNCSSIEPPSRPLTIGEVDYFVQHYIFPIQFILGVVGNSINLIVLLSVGMKNQANTLLSAMAFADLGLLFSLLPNSLASYSFFYSSINFGYLYYMIKPHIFAFANCFSTAATFLVLGVSIERFIGVRSPMHTRFKLRDKLLACLIAGIFCLAFLLTFHHHIQYSVVEIVVGCRNVWANIAHFNDGSKEYHWLKTYITIAAYLQSAVGIILPVIAVSILNISLIFFLKRREIMPRSGSDEHAECRNSSDLDAFHRQERKVTHAVIAIITCFSVTHLPSLIPFVLTYYKLTDYRLLKLRNIVPLVNMLVVSGKVINFFLFCSSSAHFRRRAMLILNANLCPHRYRKKYSSMTASALPMSQYQCHHRGCLPMELNNMNHLQGLAPAPAGASIPLNSYRRRFRRCSRGALLKKATGGIHLWRGPCNSPPATITQQLSID